MNGMCNDLDLLRCKRTSSTNGWVLNIISGFCCNQVITKETTCFNRSSERGYEGEKVRRTYPEYRVCSGLKST